MVLSKDFKLSTVTETIKVFGWGRKESGWESIFIWIQFKWTKEVVSESSEIEGSLVFIN